jgi:hypothetical protein
MEMIELEEKFRSGKLGGAKKQVLFESLYIAGSTGLNEEAQILGR